MINRVIYNGKVLYKVKDLATLFGVSEYKMRKAIDGANVGIKLGTGSGFGRAVFVLEENVAKLNPNGEVKVLETQFTVDPVKQEYSSEIRSKEPKDPKDPKNKPAKKAEQKNVEKKENVTPTEIKVENEPNIEGEEKLQKKHLKLRKEGSTLFRQFLTNGKQDLLHEICDKHMGKGNQFAYATLDDVPQMEATVMELEAEIARWNKSPNEVGKVKVSEPPSEIENVDLTESLRETESTTEQQV